MVKSSSPRGKATNNRYPTRSLKDHAVLSLQSIAPYKNTGKRLTHHHTSHGALLAIVIVAGVLIFSSLGQIQALGLAPSSGNVTITATVPGAAPTTGAELTLPVEGARVSHKRITIRGNCHGANLVALWNNGVFLGSTVANPVTNTFEMEIELNEGQNTIQAQNYDSFGQLGPLTDQIDVWYSLPMVNVVQQSVLKEESVKSVYSYLPGLQLPSSKLIDCDKQPSPDTPAQAKLTVAVSCVDQNVYAGKAFSLPLFISGGSGPYSLSIDWGDSITDTFQNQPFGLRQFTHTYKYGGAATVKITAKDANGITYFIQTVVIVNGEPAGSAGILSDIGKTSASTWIDASVPIYWALLALTVGFWVGDIFQRRFGFRRPAKRRHA